FDGGRVSKTNGSRQEVEFVLAPNKAQVDEINNDLCMVEKFLGERVINFSTRESTLLSLWRPIQAAHIMPIGDNGSYIIHFFHPVHDLLPGFASEALVKSLGNVIRSFIDYDFSGHNELNYRELLELREHDVVKEWSEEIKNLDGSQVGEESSGVNKENEAMKIG
ncbi:hypothetical protein Gohar_002624, partial [Gossypium harknessii]|nr:hypothetical protein [Gossypium harknessii]